MNGPLLLEKYVNHSNLNTVVLVWIFNYCVLTLNRLSSATQISAKTDKFLALSSRFGMKS